MIIKKSSLLAFGAVVILDQVTKYLVVKQSVFKIKFVQNPGLIFGLNLPGFFNILVIGAVLVLFAVWYFRDFQKPGTELPFAVVMGGALSNIADRLVHGRVTDFINLGVSRVNVADLAIFFGLVYLLWRVNQVSSQ